MKVSADPVRVFTEKESLYRLVLHVPVLVEKGRTDLNRLVSIAKDHLPASVRSTARDARVEANVLLAASVLTVRSLANRNVTTDSILPVNSRPTVSNMRI